MQLSRCFSRHRHFLLPLLLLLLPAAVAATSSLPTAPAGQTQTASLSATAAAEPGLGQTIGNGLAGLMICEGNGTGPVDTVILNHTLDSDTSHGVLHHFWITGNHGPGEIDEAWISYFVDGEAEPSIEFQPSRMCGQFFPELMNETDLYSAGPMCGRNSNVGGWFNTFPVPFGRSVVVTARPSADWVAKNGCLHSYINVRGTENLPIVLPLSGVALPSTARLQLQPRRGWQGHTRERQHDRQVLGPSDVDVGVQAAVLGHPVRARARCDDDRAAKRNWERVEPATNVGVSAAHWPRGV